VSIIAGVMLGLIAGFIASKIVNRRGEGMLMDIVLGDYRRLDRRVALPMLSAQRARYRH
jgi:hypothetical protein